MMVPQVTLSVPSSTCAGEPGVLRGLWPENVSALSELHKEITSKPLRLNPHHLYHAVVSVVPLIRSPRGTDNKALAGRVNRAIRPRTAVPTNHTMTIRPQDMPMPMTAPAISGSESATNSGDITDI